MNKWLARLEALECQKINDIPAPQHCQNRQNPLVSVLAGGREGVQEEIAPRPAGVDESRRQARFDRLRRWGWSTADARAAADRLALRDAGGDDRVMCAADCYHYRPGACGNHKPAGLATADLGQDLAGLLQRCPGFHRGG